MTLLYLRRVADGWVLGSAGLVAELPIGSTDVVLRHARHRDGGTVDTGTHGHRRPMLLAATRPL